MTDNQPESNNPSPDNHDNSQSPTSGGPLGNLDLSALRLSQDFASQMGAKKLVVTIPVRKPNRHAFVRVRPGEDWRFPAALLNAKDERETYLAHPELVGALGAELTPTILRMAIDRQGVTFLWPTRLPAADGRLDAWSRSAAEAAEIAETRWVSVRSNMDLGAYELFEAQGEIGEPEWPDLTMDDAIRIAFKDRFLDSNEHPALRRLRGEM